MLTLDAFEEAAAKVKEVTQETKLIESPYFSEISRNRVFFKPENMQRTGAYKVRGAYYKISTLSDEEKARGWSPLLRATTPRAWRWPRPAWASKALSVCRTVPYYEGREHKAPRCRVELVKAPTTTRMTAPWSCRSRPA